MTDPTHIELAYFLWLPSVSLVRGGSTVEPPEGKGP